MKKNKVKNIIRESIYRLLNEYSSEQRLPFDDDKFKNKNYLEQYADWLEDFGKYGKLPPSKANFQDEAKKAIQFILSNKSQKRFGKGLTDGNEIFGKYIRINKDGNIYIERQVQIKNSALSYNKSNKKGQDPMRLYKSLVDKYQNNVGGCQCFRRNKSDAYCSKENGSVITFKGYIRVEDIDFVNTILLNANYSTEYEIRVKPKAQVELIKVIFDKRYTIPLRGHLIVNATYFGNGGIYNKNYAPVNDGFGNQQYMDRHGDIMSFGDMVDKQIKRGVPLKKIFDHAYKLDNGFTLATLKDKWVLLTPNRELVSKNDPWFEYIDCCENGFFRVHSLTKGWSFVDTDGNLINNGESWFEYAHNFCDGFARVKKYGQWTFIDAKGKYISNGNRWFKHARNFYNGFATVQQNDDMWMFIDENGNYLGNEHLRFDNTYDFTNGYAKVELDGKFSFIDTNGRYIGDGHLWFREAESFAEGFAAVQRDDGMWTFIDESGRYIANGRLWFSQISNCFVDGFAKAYQNDEYYIIDTNGNVYDAQSQKLVDYTNENKIHLKHIIRESIFDFINRYKPN